MAERPARPVHRATVLRTARLTPHLVRVVFGGEGLAAFVAGEHTDHYVKLLFGVPGVSYPDPLDMNAVRRDFPREQWPRTRTYTVRTWDPEARELTVDFVHHGEKGLAGPWAAAARPGDHIFFMGPGGAYSPDPNAPWHLLAGDESALPAIAAALARVPAGVPAYVFVEVAEPADEQPLAAADGIQVTWLHRGDRQVGEALVEAVRGLDLPPGDGHAFVHGEATAVKELRRLLRVERGLEPARLSISGYWRRGHDEDGWQAGKGEFNKQTEAEERAALAS